MIRPLVVAVVFAVACGGARAAPRARPAASAPAHAPASATIWEHRQLVVGRARAEATLDELRLELDASDHHATLVATRKRAAQRPFGAQAADLRFHELSRRTLRGTATPTAGGLDLVLSGDAGETAVLHCTYEPRRVAAAHAVRVRDPSFESECGDRGVWQPPDTIETPVLACSTDAHVTGVTSDRPIDFGRAPGIELLGVSEECFLQGEGERLVPPDGSLAPAVGGVGAGGADA